MNSAARIFAQGAAFALSLLLIAGFALMPAIESTVCSAPLKLHYERLTP